MTVGREGENGMQHEDVIVKALKAPDAKVQGCRGYGYPWIYPWIYPFVDVRLWQYPWIFMDTYGYFYVTALELATSQNHNKTFVK